MQGKTVEVIKNRLILLISDSAPTVKNALYFNTDFHLKYKQFRNDFGPLNLAFIHRYTVKLKGVLENPQLEPKLLIHQTSTDFKKYTNAILLICAAMVILHHRSAAEVWESFRHLQIVPFRDAGLGQSTYGCTILDCLEGLAYAIKLGWYDFNKFDPDIYERDEKIQNGYISWIIPGKFAACSTPQPYQNNRDLSYEQQLFFHSLNKHPTVNSYCTLFKQNGINSVMRLNGPTYDPSHFIENGITHYDLFFEDGSTPSEEVLTRFLHIADNQQKVFAVHCHAGLGRTGTLLACYAMKHYMFDAPAFIGWARLCRPGSIIGLQQHYVLRIWPQMAESGKKSEIWQSVRDRFHEAIMEEKQEKMKERLKIQANNNIKSIQQYGDKNQGADLMSKKLDICN